MRRISISKVLLHLGFNSRTREGCDIVPIGQISRGLVSIHAPGRGATRRAEGDVSVGRCIVSIHAPGRGATRWRCCTSPYRRGFNSRTREGCDGVRLTAVVGGLAFQFTHPGGVRQDLQGALRYCAKFQFTHPGGVRQDLQGALRYCAKFQFTHPGGVRHKVLTLPLMPICVSIHAPGRGAT